MPIGWFIVPYKRKLNTLEIVRYCAIDDETAQIIADGGDWSETEILGNRAIVKVRASANVLTQLAAKYKRLPKNLLDDPLADLSTGVKNALRNELQDAGYSLTEIRNRLGNDLGNKTLRDVLRFMASRRLKPRYDAASDEIILDGEIQPCRDIDEVDRAV